MYVQRQTMDLSNRADMRAFRTVGGAGLKVFCS